MVRLVAVEGAAVDGARAYRLRRRGVRVELGGSRLERRVYQLASSGRRLADLPHPADFDIDVHAGVSWTTGCCASQKSLYQPCFK